MKTVSDLVAMGYDYDEMVEVAILGKLPIDGIRQGLCPLPDLASTGLADIEGQLGEG